MSPSALALALFDIAGVYRNRLAEARTIGTTAAPASALDSDPDLELELGTQKETIRLDLT